VTDCWAQGSVPKNIIPSRPISPVAEEFDEHPNVVDDAEQFTGSNKFLMVLG
jgi:hypothetical protein